MSNSSADLRNLIDACISETATADQWQQLNDLLAHDAAAREYYLAHLQIHARLLQALAGKATTAQSEPLPDEPSTSLLVRVRRRAWTLLTRPTPLSMTVAALVVGLLITAMAFIAAPIYRNLAGGSRHDADVVARLVRSDKAIWAGSRNDRADNTPLVAGQQLELLEGLAEISFVSGARMIVQGPARLQLTSPRNCRLERGSVVTRVPEAAVGFSISTDVAEIVDLGTEFGVRKAAKAGARVEVFEGSVEVRPRDPGPRNEGLVLTAGESLRIEPDGAAVAIPPEERKQENAFVRRLPSLENDYPAATSYAKLVQSYHPVLYFRMEPSRPKVLFNSGQSKRHAVLRTYGRQDEPFVAGIDGQALDLRGPPASDCAVVARYPNALQDKLTVTAWVYAENPTSWANIATNWGNSGTGQFHFGLHHEGDLAIFINDRAGQQPVARQGSRFPRHSWQHVAFVVDVDTLRLYLAGREVARSSTHGIIPASTVTAMAIGAKSNDDGSRLSLPPSGEWVGQIDELALFHDALSAKDIEKLYHARPSP